MRTIWPARLGNRGYNNPHEDGVTCARLGNRGYNNPYGYGVTTLSVCGAAIYNHVRERYDLLPSQKVKMFI